MAGGRGGLGKVVLAALPDSSPVHTDCLLHSCAQIQAAACRHHCAQLTPSRVSEQHHHAPKPTSAVDRSADISRCSIWLSRSSTNAECRPAPSQRVSVYVCVTHNAWGVRVWGGYMGGCEGVGLRVGFKVHQHSAFQQPALTTMASQPNMVWERSPPHEVN